MAAVPASASAAPIFGSDRAHRLYEVTIVSAHDLPAMDATGKSDPYCTVSFGPNQVHRTPTIMRNLNPVWNDKFRLLVLESQESWELKFTVFDYDKATKDDLCGGASLSLAPYNVDDVLSTVTLPVTRVSKKKGIKTKGSLTVSIKPLSRDRIESTFWRQMMEKFDNNANGTLDEIELDAMLQQVGSEVDSEQVHQFFTTTDADASGSLSFNELLSVWMKSGAERSPLLPNDPDFILKALAASKSNDENYASLVENAIEWANLSIKVTREKTVAKEILVQNRKTGQVETEKIPQSIKVALRLMYANDGGRTAVSGAQIQKVLKRMTVNQGNKYDKPDSVKEIPHFVQFHRLNEDEMLQPSNSFPNFNAFFYRKLKTEARPIDEPSNGKVAVSPADCRLNVFPTVHDSTQLWIKGKDFNLRSLLKDDALAAQYESGSLLIARLAPQDYHRFHSPVDGVVGTFTPIDGTYYTVNPIAINTATNVYCENKRCRTTITSPDFGEVLFVAVGATMVGSIVMTAKAGSTVKKGDEIGYFQFGGSTVLLLFQQGKIKFDNDLLRNSAKPIETLVQMGNRVGSA